MFFAVRPLRRTAWFALVAMFWLALAPTVSHALALSRGESPWQVICSAEGQRRISTDSGKPDGDDAGLHHGFEHCPYCALHATAAPPPAPMPVLAAERRHEQPALFLSAPRTLHAWRHALSRGPPALA